jgi:LysR family transcriptional regulator, transcriptional activator of nhaA
MEWLNYHHLLYFWMVAREGGLAKAAAKLRLSHPTVSGQIRALERELGEKLFQKQGRRLVLTEMGRVVYDYADEIFGLGRELLDTVRGRPSGRPARLVVGIAEVVPKLIAKELLAPARQLASRVVCREDKSERLVAELASLNLDVVISDAPIPAGSNFKAFNHLLGECGVSVFGTRALANKYKKGFPRSLHEAPMLLPTEAASVRRSLDSWFDSQGVRPDIQGEFDDSALMEVFGQDGAGLFPASTPLEATVRKQFDVELLGRLPEVRERFYAISVERRIKHPAVVAISQAAREQLFKVAG